MILDTAIKRIESVLGFRKGLEDRAKSALDEAQEEIEGGLIGLLPWFLISDADIQVPQGADRVDLPIGFLREFEGRNILTVKNNPSVRFVRQTKEPFGLLPDGQVAYWFSPRQILFDRPTLQALTLVFVRYQRDTPIRDLDLPEENAWLKEASRLLIGEAGRKLIGARDRTAHVAFEEMSREGERGLVRAHAARLYGGARTENPFLAGADRTTEEISITIGPNDNDLDRGF